MEDWSRAAHSPYRDRAFDPMFAAVVQVLRPVYITSIGVEVLMQALILVDGSLALDLR